MCNERIEFMPLSITDPTAQTDLRANFISRISASASEMIVAGRLHAEGRQCVEVFALQPYDDVSFASMEGREALLSVNVDCGADERQYAFTAHLNRYDAASQDRLYNKFVVAARGEDGMVELIGAKHATVFESVALNDFPFPDSLTKKGLQVQMTDDAIELGIGHAALNFNYGEVLRPDEGTDTIAYAMEGKTYYLDKRRIESLDRNVKALSDHNVVVSLILLVYPGNLTIPAMMHPDYKDGIVGAFNTSESGIRYYKAVTEFIIERYTRSDGRYGRAVNYIVGNEVNSGGVWYDMGDKSLRQFVEDYARTVRITYLAAMKKYSHARVYISLDHFWSVAIEQRSGFFPGKTVLDEFNRTVKQEGNFPWHIAYHPYPENLGNPRTWEDRAATDRLDTERITFKNLHLLPDYLSRDEMLCAGSPRRIILSEQGFHTPNPDDPEDQRTQAAAYAYAYYKVLFNEGIDSFILHRHVDHGGEGGLHLGIWSRKPDSISTPKAKKMLWDVMQRIDTADSAAVTAFAKEVIGIADWSEAVPRYDESALDRVRPAE